jgi:hypothetical protein
VVAIKEYLIKVSICIFLITDDIEYSAYAYWQIFFEKIVQVIKPFKIFDCFLYIIDSKEIIIYPCMSVGAHLKSVVKYF